MSTKVLAIEEDERLRQWLGHHVSALWPRSEIEFQSWNQIEMRLAGLAMGRYHVVMLGLDAEQPAALNVVPAFLRKRACPPVLILADGGDELTAVKAMKMGASDYLPKRLLSGDMLVDALRGAVSERERSIDEARWQGKPMPEIPGYVIIRPINRTRYSSVYLALSESREEQVALKVLDRRGHDVDEDALERFRSEYEIGCSIEGPHVAEVYEFGVQDDLAFIALEYFAGGDLKKRMEQPMLPRHCVRLLRQIAEALEAIHEAGIIHGDLKPGNIMMRADGSIALIDFGLSRQSGGAAAKETIVEGTPLYLSPERADGLEADERGDLYALGAIFYQMLIGEPPFNGASATEVIGAHRSQPIPRLASPLDRYHFVLDGLLEKHPEHRIGSAAELLVALDHFDAYLVAEAG